MFTSLRFSPRTGTDRYTRRPCSSVKSCSITSFSSGITDSKRSCGGMFSGP